MKNLHKKISAVAVASMVVLGGIVVSGVIPVQAAEARKSPTG